jgi:hypothetical protein
MAVYGVRLLLEAMDNKIKGCLTVNRLSSLFCLSLKNFNIFLMLSV